MNIKIRQLKKGIFVLLTLFLFSIPLYAQLKVEGQGNDLVIKNATILTITKGIVKNGSVLIQNGKIRAIGDNIKIPKNSRPRFQTNIIGFS